MIIGQNAKDKRSRRQSAQIQAAHQYPDNFQGRSRQADPIVPMTLEQAMAYIQDDELVEVTPQNIRIRKRR